MAGIGFALKRFYKQDSLAGLLKVYAHSVLASAGPWIMTVLALSLIMILGSQLTTHSAIANFKSVLIYNFCFSLVLAGPLFMILTRYLSDGIYNKDLTKAPGALLGSLVLFAVTGLPMAGCFYFLYTDLPPTAALMATLNFTLLGMIWMISVFLSVMKDYHAITLAFLGGMITAVISSVLLSNFFASSGMLTGFNFGFAVVIALLLGRVCYHYPDPPRQIFAFLPYFRKYWEIALGGLAYNSAIWVDKWIMWHADEAQQLSNKLLMYPHYDSAMFFAFLAILPTAAMFLYFVETNFFGHYVRFYRDIQNKAPLDRINANHQAMVNSIFRGVTALFLTQAGLCAALIVGAPSIIDALHGDYLQIGMFRYGVLGVLFHAMALVLMILLSYFDQRRLALLLSLCFLLTNAAFTWLTREAGFPYYGYGYFLASFVVFILTAACLAQHLKRLPYHTFITSNAALQR
jgi:uncharacterized membrane protein